MNQREKLLDLLEKHPEWRERKYRYTVISNLTNIEPEVCKLICSIADDFRHITKVDEVGEALAREWEGTSSFWSESTRLSKKMQNDLQKFG